MQVDSTFPNCLYPTKNNDSSEVKFLSTHGTYHNRLQFQNQGHISADNDILE